MQRIPLTPQQHAVYKFMVEFFRDNDQLPPSREIQRHFGWQSQTAAVRYYEVLSAKGWITPNLVNRYKFTHPIEV